MRLVPDLSNPAFAIRQHGIQGPARRIAPARQQEGKPIQLIQNGLGDQCVVQNKIVRGIRRTGARITSPSPSFSESQSIRFLLASPCRTSKPPTTPYDEAQAVGRKSFRGIEVAMQGWSGFSGQASGGGRGIIRSFLSGTPSCQQDLHPPESRPIGFKQSRRVDLALPAQYVARSYFCAS